MPRKKKLNDAVDGVLIERPALPAGVLDQLEKWPRLSEQLKPCR